jgi:GDP-L-fucose synthase
MPTNLYGPGDNFSPQRSHVLPALIHRFVEAKEAGAESVTNWGTGSPLREFMHVDDLADAIVFLLENYDSPETINVGTGEDLSILAISELVAKVVGYTGTIEWDTTKKDGTPRKLLDVSRLRSLGWTPHISLEDGLAQTVNWYLSHRETVRQ